MMRHRTLEHRFVRNVPRELEPGVLYISMEYATAVHSCCCGCGERVVTPFTPTDWSMEFDGESVTLEPSVGNWNQACRSHYLIRRNQVIEAGPWSAARIEAERRRDKKVKAAYYGTKVPPAHAQPDASSTSSAGGKAPTSGPLSRLLGWLSK
ncbi:DUF6527 family protein [Roseateles sp. BYS87W]|uniref:DUF6527 family protein n=1 Tax=Pelomonas baiyunensis TaxID=3299026 RepID=A0ABW7H2D9_9BURK